IATDCLVLPYPVAVAMTVDVPELTLRLKLPWMSVSAAYPQGSTETAAPAMGRRVWLSITWPAIVAQPGVALGVGRGSGLLGVGSGDGTGRGVGVGDNEAAGFGVATLRPGVGVGMAGFNASWLASSNTRSESGATRW